jgi:hypothetical protein
MDPEDLSKVLSFLDGQSRVDLAVWVGIQFSTHVQHQVACRLVGRRPAPPELNALYFGLLYDVSTHCYLEFPTRQKMRQIESVGETIWNGPPAADGDPLDYRYEYEKVDLREDVLRGVVEVGKAHPTFKAIHIVRSILLKSDAVVHDAITVSVERDDSIDDARDANAGWSRLNGLLRIQFSGVQNLTMTTVASKRSVTALRTLYEKGLP